MAAWTRRLASGVRFCMTRWLSLPKPIVSNGLDKLDQRWSALAGQLSALPRVSLRNRISRIPRSAGVRVSTHQTSRAFCAR